MFKLIKQLLSEDNAGSTKASSGKRKNKAAKPKPVPGRHTFTLHAPICSPPRDVLEKALTTYGVKDQQWGTNMQMLSDKTLSHSFVFMDVENPHRAYTIGQRVTLTVNKSQAEWTEYLLLRKNFCDVVAGNVNGKNRDWAARHAGKMPKPWIDSKCTNYKPKKGKAK